MRAIPIVALLFGAALSAQAQAPPSQSDSLARELARLKARIDSLEQLVRQLSPQAADTASPEDELAALRAAARAAAAQRDTAPAAAAPTPQFVERSRDLNRLNPEISVTGDVRVHADRDAPVQDNVEVREFEFSFQSALDPYSNTKIFLSLEEGEIDLEEAYAYWTALPGRLRLDVGRFRQQIGELNRWHSHALPGSEYPLVLREFFGEEGLVGNGVGLYWVAPFGGGAAGTYELWGQVTLADNEVLFDGGNRLSGLGHLNAHWELSRSSFFQLGASGLYGENPDADLKTRVVGFDARFSWRPPERAMYRSFTLRGEGYALTREVAGTSETRLGGYVNALYQLGRQWYVGAQYDLVELAPGVRHWQISPHITWWQSEWVYFRAEWQRPKDGPDRLVIQAVWSIGPHKHEIY
ncbi:MAG: hypothetical protein KatS3mg081_1705 [Gemmatimonadales bacterium]|nr:MAG: hypothetical protein KatS3mg081_1705 [Gemmatimonadales bacterium]